MLLLAPVLLAPATADGQAPLVRDSAGIAIIDNVPLERGREAPLRVTLRPALQLGVQDGDPNQQFSEIAAAVSLGNGSFAVADQGSGEIRIFDRAGRFVRKVGRKGRGPGEFQRLAYLIALPGDSLLAWDALGGRFTVFSPSGAVARTFAAQVPPGTSPATVVPVCGVPANSSLFGYHRLRAAPPASEAVVRDTLVVALYARDGAHLRTVDRFPALETLQHMSGTMPGLDGRPRQAFSIAGVPFARETVLCASPEWLYAGDGGTSYEIMAYDRLGKLRRIIRLRRPLERVTADVIARHRSTPRGRGTPSRPNPSPTVDAAFYPKTMPAYAAFRLDGAERLWVRDYPVPGETQSRWHIFDGAGRLVASVLAPSDIEVLAIGSKYLLAVWRDELDVEYLRVYEVSTSG